MARKSKKDPNSLTKVEIEAILKKLLKNSSNISATEVIFLNQTRKEFPNRNFWIKYDFPFQLNSLAWFKTPKGKEMMTYAYQSFLFNFKDTDPSNGFTFDEEFKLEKLPDDTKKKSKSISDFLKRKVVYKFKK